MQKLSAEQLTQLVSQVTHALPLFDGTRLMVVLSHVEQTLSELHVRQFAMLQAVQVLLSRVKLARQERQLLVFVVFNV